jgi:hypothetical protein
MYFKLSKEKRKEEGERGRKGAGCDGFKTPQENNSKEGEEGGERERGEERERRGERRGREEERGEGEKRREERERRGEREDREERGRKVMRYKHQTWFGCHQCCSLDCHSRKIQHQQVIPSK